MNGKSPPKRATEILDAAAAVFAEKGFHGAGTKDIADRLKIKQAGVYYYFKSKDAALAEVCRLGVADYLERLKAITRSNHSPDDMIRLAVIEHLKPFQRLPTYVRVFHNERRYLVGENRAQVNELATRYEKELRKIFRLGIKEGVFKKGLDVRMTTLALLGLCNSVATWYRGGTESEIETIAETYADIFIKGVMAAS